MTYCHGCGSESSWHHYPGCPVKKRETERLKAASWGVFVYTTDSGHLAEHRGYVAREVTADGYGAHAPYRQQKAVRVFRRRSDANRLADKLTFGASRDRSRRRRRR